MKRNVILCTCLLTALLLGGCARTTAQAQENAGTTDSGNTAQSTTQTDGAQSTTQTDGTQSMAQNSTTENVISEEEAKRIALERVPGATEQNITEFRSDYDDGRLEYEGEIRYGETEYEFEIDGYTGQILEWDEDPIYNGTAH